MPPFYGPCSVVLTGDEVTGNEPAVAIRFPLGFTGEVPTVTGWMLVGVTDSDEPGPDAMRWTPEEADAEIDAWQAILHPAP